MMKISPVSNILKLLKRRNYRLFFFGQSISLTGTWLQSIALSWLIYRITGSEVLLGVMQLLSQIPIFLLSPLTGVFADRHSRYKILFITQTLSTLQALALAYFVLRGDFNITLIFALVVILAIINAFDVPARQSFVFDMVGKEDLGSAIALNSSVFNGTRIIGPAIGGMLILHFGEGYCFLINGISYLAVLASFLLMKIDRHIVTVQPLPLSQQLKEGFSYVHQHIPIKILLLFLALIALFGMPSVLVLLPVFAKEILKGDARILGILSSSTGIGALCGALLLAGRVGISGLRKKIFRTSMLFGASLMAFSLSKNLILSSVCLAVYGFGIVYSVVAIHTIIQNLVSPEMRGRVMGIYSMIFMGCAPLGGFLAGVTAHKIGAPITVAFAGTVCSLGALFFLLGMRTLRRKILIKEAHPDILIPTAPV